MDTACLWVVAEAVVNINLHAEGISDQEYDMKSKPYFLQWIPITGRLLAKVPDGNSSM